MATVKGFHGWKAEDYFDMTELMKSIQPELVSNLRGERRYELQIYTMKTYSGSINTMAQMGVRELGRFENFTFEMYEDFREHLQSISGERSTEKTITKYQAEAVAKLDQIKENIKTFYAKKAEKEARGW